MRKHLLFASALLILLPAVAGFIMMQDDPAPPAVPAESEMSLITSTPEEGFQLALTLSRLGVTETQPDREVLHSLRPAYATDANALIASSHVVAVHFQTVAAANNYWRD